MLNCLEVRRAVQVFGQQLPYFSAAQAGSLLHANSPPFERRHSAGQFDENTASRL